MTNITLTHAREKVDILEEAMETGCGYGWKKMYFLEEELDEISKKSDETVEETRCDSHLQIYEMEEKVYAKAENQEETRRARHWQTAEIIDEDKEKVTEVQQLASRKMDEKMAYTEENTIAVR